MSYPYFSLLVYMHCPNERSRRSHLQPAHDAFRVPHCSASLYAANYVSMLRSYIDGVLMNLSKLQCVSDCVVYARSGLWA